MAVGGLTPDGTGGWAGFSSCFVRICKENQGEMIASTVMAVR